MELTWKNGVVVDGSCNDTVIRTEEHVGMELLPTEDESSFIHEDENDLASWLQYTLDESFDRECYSDLLPFAQPAPTNSGVPISPDKPNYPHFSRFLSEPPLITAIDRELMLSSSAGCSNASLVPPQKVENPARREKRSKWKAREHNNHKCCQGEGTKSKVTEDKTQSHGPVLTKRSRVAETHNISEKRRRDRINVRIRTLQELIPGCKKTDIASILQAAIEYLKLLQLQIQMLSISCGMNPMMYPAQHYPYLATVMGMNQAIVPYPMMYPAMQQYPYLATVMGMNQATIPYPTIQSGADNPSQRGIPNFVSAYQQFLGPQLKQIQAPQNQESVQPNGNRPSHKDIKQPENQKTGSEYL